MYAIADIAEKRSIMMMVHRGQLMAGYLVIFGFAIALLKNPDDLDIFSAWVVVGFYGLISFYYLIGQRCFYAPRLLKAIDAIEDPATRRQIHRDASFRRISYGIFILLSFTFIAFLGMYNG